MGIKKKKTLKKDDGEGRHDKSRAVLCLRG